MQISSLEAVTTDEASAAGKPVFPVGALLAFGLVDGDLLSVGHVEQPDGHPGAAVQEVV